jgi:hypothetical protein
MGATLTTPAGWTKVYDNNGLGAAATNNNALFQKTSAGEQSIAVTYSRDDGLTLYLVELTGATGLATGFLQMAGATSQVLTDTVPGDLVMFMGCTNGGSAGGAATGWAETYVNGGVPFHMGDYQYYTRTPVTTTYQTTYTSGASNVIFSVPSVAIAPGAHLSQEALVALVQATAMGAQVSQEAAVFLLQATPPTKPAQVSQQALVLLYLPTSSIAPVLAVTSQAMFSYFPLRAAVSRV